jgi:hypothetical protein
LDAFSFDREGQGLVLGNLEGVRDNRIGKTANTAAHFSNFRGAFAVGRNAQLCWPVVGDMGSILLIWDIDSALLAPLGAADLCRFPLAYLLVIYYNWRVPLRRKRDDKGK